MIILLLRLIWAVVNNIALTVTVSASYPGPFEKSEKRAWYPLFAHALN